MNKTKSVLIILLLLASVISNAQMGMGKIEDIEASQSRKLIVMVEEPQQKMLDKISKKPKLGSVDDYKADLKTYNANMKEVVEKFWPYNKEGIQYKTYDEIMALKKSMSKEYAVLCCISTKPSSNSSGYDYSDGLYWVKDIKEDFEEQGNFMFTMMFTNVIEDFGKFPVYLAPLFDVFPTKAALAYGFQTTSTYFDLRMSTKKAGGKMKDEVALLMQAIAEKGPKLKEKTLLMRSEWLDKALTEANFKDYYPYKYKICDRAMMDEIIMSQDDKYAYGVELPYVISGSTSNNVMYFQYVIDAQDSKIMAYTQPNTSGMFKHGLGNFTPDTLKKMAEQANGKK